METTAEFLQQLPIFSELGLEGSWVMTFIAINAIIMSGFMIWRMSGSFTLLLLSTGMGLFVMYFLGLIPIWVMFIGIFLNIVTMAFRVFEGGFGWGGSSEKEEKPPKKYEPTTQDLLLVQSEKCSELWNNIDDIFGVKTAELRLPEDEKGCGLKLYGVELQISPIYDWFITDKTTDGSAIKIVGYPKGKRGTECTFILTKKNDKPYISKIDNKYMLTVGNMDEIMKSVSEKDSSMLVAGMISTMIGMTLLPAIENMTNEIIDEECKGRKDMVAVHSRRRKK